MRDLALAEGADLFHGDDLSVAQAHPGAELFAVARIRDADDLHVLDLWVAVEKLLDLARVNILAAADHHVFDPAHDVAIAFFVDRREVAGVHPSGRINCLVRFLLVFPIAEHDQIAASQELAGGTARHDPTLDIDDLRLDMRQDPADRRYSPLDRIASRRRKARRARLSHAVADDDLGEVHQREGPLHDLDRARASGHHASAQRREIELCEIGVVHLRDKHRRHAVHSRAALLGDGFEGGERIETFAGIDHRRTMRQAAEIADHHAKTVIERHWNAYAV